MADDESFLFNFYVVNFSVRTTWTVKNQSPPPGEGDRDHGTVSALCPPCSCEPGPVVLVCFRCSLHPACCTPSAPLWLANTPAPVCRALPPPGPFPAGHLILRGQPHPRRVEPERVLGVDPCHVLPGVLSTVLRAGRGCAALSQDHPAWTLALPASASRTSLCARHVAGPQGKFSNSPAIWQDLTPCLVAQRWTEPITLVLSLEAQTLLSGW